MSTNSSSNKRIAKNTAFLYVRMVFVMLVTLYTVRVVLSALGEIDYGVYNVVCGFVSLFGVLNTTLSSGTSRFYNYEIGRGGNKAANQVYNTSFFIQFSAAILVFLLVELVGSWYIGHKMVIPTDRLKIAKMIFHFSVISLFFEMIKTPYSAAVIAFEKMNFFAIVGILDACIKLGIALFISYSHSDKLLIYGVLMSIISVVNFLAYFIFCKVKFKDLKLNWPFDNSLFKPMLSFSGWLILDPIAYTLKGQGSNVALNYFHGPVLNTAFGISNQVSVALDSFSSNIGTAFRPQMIQSYSSGDYIRTKSLFYSMSKIMFVLKVLLCIPLLLETDTILHIWLGNDFPSIAISFVKLMILAGVINSFGPPITIVVSATGQIKRYMIITSFIVSAVLPLSILLMSFGVNPVCIFWLMLISALVNIIVCVFIVSRVFPPVRPKDYFKTVFMPCLIHTAVSLFLPLCLVSIMNPSLLRLIIVILADCIVSFVSIYYIVFDSKERLFFSGHIKRVLRMDGI